MCRIIATDLGEAPDSIGGGTGAGDIDRTAARDSLVLVRGRRHARHDGPGVGRNVVLLDRVSLRIATKDVPAK